MRRSLDLYIIIGGYDKVFEYLICLGAAFEITGMEIPCYEENDFFSLLKYYKHRQQNGKKNTGQTVKYDIRTEYVPGQGKSVPQEIKRILKRIELVVIKLSRRNGGVAADIQLVREHAAAGLLLS